MVGGRVRRRKGQQFGKMRWFVNTECSGPSCSGYSIRFAVGRLGFNSLVKSFPVLLSARGKTGEKISKFVCCVFEYDAPRDTFTFMRQRC